MIILGIKLTHDGAVALIDDGKLIFCYEMEKIDNFPRYSDFCIPMEAIDHMLSEYDYRWEELDKIVIDGWTARDPDKIDFEGSAIQPIIVFPWKESRISITTVDLAGYGHFVKADDDTLAPLDFKLNGGRFAYRSYLHVSGHIASAYCSSPFPAQKADSYVLVWDGGMPPQLFYYKHAENAVVNLGKLFNLCGNIYTIFACAFEPFHSMEPGLSIAGKAMAYMALGKIDNSILQKYKDIFLQLNEIASGIDPDMDMISILTQHFVRMAKEFGVKYNCADVDMLTTFQEFVKGLLIESMETKLKEHPEFSTNLCMAGGCALNIKWNAALRASGIFQKVWVPPFPNDSGSAIGAACCEMIVSNGNARLEWDVYSGPLVRAGKEEKQFIPSSEGFVQMECTLKELAGLLFKHNEPVVFLSGRAELGPRALGNRSILAPAISSPMKGRLNFLKNREGYRPVAPICLEVYAGTVFNPGFPDPYMLFEHEVKSSWRERVPAICHLDNTARLQTVNSSNGKIFELLSYYYELSGIPLLCNTSANFNGSGFFPDVESAMRWGKAVFIWSEGNLFVQQTFAGSSSLRHSLAINSAI